MSRKQFAGALLFVVLIALAARWQFPLPGTDIPQTAQTIAVLLGGALLGFNAGSISIFLYLLAGAVGLPVFADGRGGAGVLFGPSGGYLLGFWFAAALTGYLADKRKLRRPLGRLLLWMLAGHAIILALGGGLLAITIGPTAAWLNGVEPFLIGAAVKSLIAAVLIAVIGLAVQRT